MAQFIDDHVGYRHYVDQAVSKALSQGLGTNGVTETRVILKYGDQNLSVGSSRYDRGALSATVRVFISLPTNWKRGELWLDLRKSAPTYRRFVLQAAASPDPQKTYTLSTVTDVFDPRPILGDLDTLLARPAPPQAPVLVFTDSEDPLAFTTFSESKDLSSPDPGLAAVPYSLYVTPQGQIFGYNNLPTPGYFSLKSVAQDFSISAPSSPITLPLPLSTNSRFEVRVNGVVYDSSFYTLTPPDTLTWIGPFTIDPTDEVVISYY